jgi:hypothetical protein
LSYRVPITPQSNNPPEGRVVRFTPRITHHFIGIGSTTKTGVSPQSLRGFVQDCQVYTGFHRYFESCFRFSPRSPRARRLNGFSVEILFLGKNVDVKQYRPFFNALSVSSANFNVRRTPDTSYTSCTCLSPACLLPIGPQTWPVPARPIPPPSTLSRGCVKIGPFRITPGGR